MIVSELAYKVTIRAEEFLNGKRKVSEEVSELEKEFSRAEKERQEQLKKTRDEIDKFGRSAVSAFRGAGTAMAGFLGIGAGLYGIKQLFTSTTEEIVRASQQAKFFGSDVNRMFGVKRGFQQAGLNGDNFLSAAGSARMALANIADPTVFGGLTGEAQNLMVIGARTGLNINQLGDPNNALNEFTRFSQTNSQEKLMQVMAATGFDPTDAAKIKSGELKSLVDSETKKSNITAAQVKEQEKLLATLGQLDSEFSRLRKDLAMAFAPEVIAGMKAFGEWIEKNHGNIIGFFNAAGDKVKAFTDAVGGAENALKILAGMYVGGKLAGAAGGSGSKVGGGLLGALGAIFYSSEIADALTPNSILEKTDDERPFIFQHHWWERLWGLNYDEPNANKPRNPSGKTLAEKNNNPGNIRGKSGLSGFAGYASEQEGWDAMSNQLMRYFNGFTTGKKLRTIEDILTTWAPPSENDTESYIKDVSSYMRIGAKDELNLSDPNVMAKLRAAIARREGFGNWQNGLQISGANQYQNEYYLQQQRLANSRPTGGPSSVDNSKTSSTHIGTVVVNSNPQSADALSKSINQQVQRSSTNASFASGVQ